MSAASASVGRRLTQAICLIISVAFGLIVFFFAQQQHRNIRLQNERAMNQVVETVSQGLQSVMITGSADVALVYAEKLKEVRSVEDFRILRNTGIEAFRDNATIDAVNHQRKRQLFEPRAAESVVSVIEADDMHLLRAVETARTEYYYHPGATGGESLTFLLPIRNEKKCHRCHGKDSEVLGVLKLTSSMASVEAAVRETWLRAAFVLVLALFAVLAVTYFVLRRYIIGPIATVSAAMKKVAESDLNQTVPVIGQDELARMAADFNLLTSELRESYDGLAAERNKLQTIIMGTEEGIVVADGHGKVILVNPAAEVLLGKSRAVVTEHGFLQLLDDPQRIQAATERSTNAPRGNDVLLYNERFLALFVSTLHAADGHLLGHAAVIRDVTKERRLEQKLRELSNTDALTGLANRRALDETLDAEFALAKAQGRPLSLLMFDVDHFKRFNDTYGHARGDDVLVAFARTTLHCAREILDTVCRYGGEEFMVIARETPQEGARVLAERIREAVAAMDVDGLRVTASIGVAGVQETAATSPLQLIEYADAALYRAKAAGRNRVEVAPKQDAGA